MTRAGSSDPIAYEIAFTGSPRALDDLDRPTTHRRLQRGCPAPAKDWGDPLAGLDMERRILKGQHGAQHRQGSERGIRKAHAPTCGRIGRGIRQHGTRLDPARDGPEGGFVGSIMPEYWRLAPQHSELMMGRARRVRLDALEINLGEGSTLAHGFSQMGTRSGTHERGTEP